MIGILAFNLPFSFQVLAQSVNSTQNSTSEFQRINESIGTLGGNIPTVFETIGLALLGILIPLAIVVLQDILQKSVDIKDDHSIVDLHVILDKVFQLKYLIFFSSMVFLPFLFWDIPTGFLRVIEIALAIVGVVFILRIILTVYDWTKGNVATYRKKYLESLDNNEDMPLIWKLTWKNKMSLQDEKVYFDVFSTKIDGLIDKNENKH